MLRRARGEGGEALTDLRNGPIWLRATSRSVTVDEKPVALTATEFDLLALLLREAGRVVSKERISQSVLGRPLGPFDRSIDVHVSNLRRKLGTTNDGTSPITTIHRSGYLFPPARRAGLKDLRSHPRTAHAVTGREGPVT